MQGRISAVNHLRHSGHIQSDDGAILYFDESSFAVNSEKNEIAAEMRVQFEAAGDRAVDLTLLDKEEFNLNQRRYAEPYDMELIKGSFKEGYEIIDKGTRPLIKSDRNPNIAQNKLKQALSEVGANTGLNFKLEEDKKTAMGYAFAYYYAIAYPAVLGRQDESSESYFYDLKQKLNHKEVERQGRVQASVFIGRKALRVMTLAVLAVSIFGFALSVLLGAW